MSRLEAEAQTAATGRKTAWWRGAGPLALLAALVLGAYLAHPLLHGYRLPIGPDGPVYVWWARFVEEVGMDGVRRPGVPGLIAALASALGQSEAAIVAALGPVLAAATGLAAASLTRAAFGPDPLRALTTGSLAAAFAAFLAPGWLGNLALAAAFLAATAALATGERSWRGVWLGAALLAAGGIAHLPFLLVGLAILGGAILSLGPDAIRRARGGEDAWSTLPARAAVGTALGGGAALLGAAVLAGGTVAPGDTSQDQFFRRTGLEGFLRERLRERFGSETLRLAPALVAGGVLAAGADAEGGAGTRRRFFQRLVLSWAIVTLAGIAIMWVTVAGAPSRMLSFAFFLPLGAGLGLAAALRSGRIAIRVGALLVAAVFVAGSMWSWYRHHPYVAPEELAAVQRAGVGTLPPGTPVVFLIDTEELAAGFHVARFGNVIRSGVPPGRIGDTRLVIGSPEDLLAGRPGATSEDPEYAALSRAYHEEAEPVLDRAAVLVVRPFNEPGWAGAVRLGTVVTAGVAQLAGPAVEALPAEAAGIGGAGSAGLAIGILLLLTLLGGGWARWAIADRGAALGLAPSAGLGLAILSALLADRAGLGVAAGMPVAGALAIAGYLLARSRHEPVDRAEQPRA